LLGVNSTFIGLVSFGASALADELCAQFGITVNTVIDAANALIKGT